MSFYRDNRKNAAMRALEETQKLPMYKMEVKTKEGKWVRLELRSRSKTTLRLHAEALGYSEVRYITV